ncbi:MAG TPA: TetR/AcrR family transcriptional regulator [Methanofastidiosum sp.]|nr:TetR/AcrR family transcriptional regulator [Methanofastidiosum sp.]HPA49203.1 TetR/AcrR family transcriptional regulator [Methanofastidiosum sp.]HQK62279.1 TetR/AcrR family transcriptional regulator [Methanofastidiosum sp.]HQM94764.1 TetR/AcrR family transcriptional regulator [Methanofastidiosum sp.]HQQ48502.1 TetR/AcrR family transcriptional regulator [Methanofastidiosum sp.]
MPKVVPEYREEAKIRIIKKSVKFFSEKGYHQTKMSEIADSLGVSKAALYQYFESKEELFIQVMQYYIESVHGELILFLKTKHPKEIMDDEFFDIMFDIKSKDNHLLMDALFPPLDFNLAISEIIKSNPSMKNEMTKYYKEATNLLSDYFNDYKKRGIIKRDIDTASLSMGIMSLQDGLMTAVLMGVEIKEIRKTWKEITKMMLNNSLVSPNL